LQKNINNMNFLDYTFKEVFENKNLKEIKIKKKVFKENIIIENMQEILNEIKPMLDKRWVFMRNKNVFYDNEVVALFPKLDKFDGFTYSTGDGYGKIRRYANQIYKRGNNLEWDIFTFKEFKKTVCNKNFPYRVGDYLKYKDSRQPTCLYRYSKDSDNMRYGYVYNTSWNHTGCCDPIIENCYLNTINSPKLKNVEVLMLWLENGLIPANLTESTLEKYKMLLKMSEKEEIDFKDKKWKLNINKLMENKKYLDSYLVDEIIFEDLLLCDKKRADIDKYDIKILFDPNRGHWELWENNNIKDTITIPLN